MSAMGRKLPLAVNQRLMTGPSRLAFGDDTYGVDGTGARAHDAGRFCDQLIQLLWIESFTVRPQFQVSLQTQDDAPFGSVKLPFMPASQDVTVFVRLSKAAILVHARAAQQLAGVVSFQRSAELSRYWVAQ